MSDYPNILLFFLFFTLIAWLTLEIYQSIIFKFAYHWLYHSQDTKRKDSISSSEGYEQLEKVHGCSISLIECALFLPRDDLAYEIQRVRREIQERKTKLIALRKPKNMFVQTLKCMLTINKKIKQRRRSSEDESESSENNEDNPQDELLGDDREIEISSEILSDSDEEVLKDQETSDETNDELLNISNFAKESEKYNVEKSEEDTGAGALKKEEFENDSNGDSHSNIVIHQS